MWPEPGSIVNPCNLFLSAFQLPVSLAPGCGTRAAARAQALIWGRGILVAPVVDLNGPGAGTGTTLAHSENAAATAIAPAGGTTDVDSQDFNGGSLRVAFTANGAAEDQLSILTDGTV